MAFQCCVTSEINSSRIGLVWKIGSLTTSPPQISGRYSLGSTVSGPQISCEKPVHHLKVHRALVAKAFEYVGELVELYVG